MKSRTKAASVFLLFAMVLSLVPAAVAPSQASAAQTCTDRAQFIRDVTVPDGTRYEPGAAFTKVWQLKNVGTCTWTTSYSLVFDSGERMGAPESSKFANSIAPGQIIDVTVNMTAPSKAGSYRGYWKFKNASGISFGIGTAANRPWWVEIVVTGSTQTGVVYNFTEKASSATWSSGAGGLTFPGKEGDTKGFALKLDKPTFESSVTATQPGLLVVPQQITNGFIQARYEDFTVQSGDRFQTTVGCQAGAPSCYVAYRLDYETGGAIRTFWTFRERHEGLTYSANLDLSPLAGKTVKFILYVSAYGSPVGDRALWGNPVIVRKGVTTTPTVVVTGTPPTATATSIPPTATATVPASSCDKAAFVRDVTVPDGTITNPGQTFTKTWELRNVGTCAWTKSYQLVFFSGERMGAATSYAFSEDVPVGKAVRFSVPMTAPSAAGSYRGYWMFKNAKGDLFGIGSQANKPWWVDIRVSGPTVTPGGPTPTPSATPTGPTPTPIANSAYNFVAEACNASWFSGAGALPCPGSEKDAKGFVVRVNNPKLETGATDNRPGLLTFPQNIQNGYIQGFYPPFPVRNGDRFRSIINCEGGATLCYVAFRLDYQTGNDPIQTLWGPFLERYDEQYYSMDVDLSVLAGKNVKFILTVLSAGTATGDRAMWVGPHIYRPGGTTPTPISGTISPTPTTPVAATTTVATTAVATTAVPTTAVPTTATTPAASTYQNTKYNFKFTLPQGASIVSQTDNVGRVSLPIVTPGTNLLEKYIQIHVVENANPCVSPAVDGVPTSTENITINGIQFVKTTGQGAAAGNRYDWTVYATTQDNACITLAFILHSANPGNYATPPPEFDMEEESAVVGTTMNTFMLIDS